MPKKTVLGFFVVAAKEKDGKDVLTSYPYPSVLTCRLSVASIESSEFSNHIHNSWLIACTLNARLAFS